MGLKYVARVGISYPDGKGGESRAEPGQEVPATVVEVSQWLLGQGLVEAVETEEGGDERGENPWKRRSSAARRA